MRHLNSVNALSLVSFLLVSFAFAENPEVKATCEISGQYLVYRQGEQLKVGLCRTEVFGLSAVNGYHSKTLKRILETNRGDTKFVASLNQVGVGKDYNSALKEIDAFGGILNIESDAIDREALDYIAKVMNTADGITEQLTALRDRKQQEAQSRDTRNRTPVTVTMESIKAMTEQNRKAAARLDERRCDIRAPESLNQLKILKVKFADGDEALMLPSQGSAIDGSRFEFESINSGKGLGGLQFAKGTPKRRYLKFEGGKVYWGSLSDQTGALSVFKEYEVKEFTEIAAKDALGWTRPLGAGESYDQCFYARALAPKAGGAAKSSEATQ